MCLARAAGRGPVRSPNRGWCRATPDGARPGEQGLRPPRPQPARDRAAATRHPLHPRGPRGTRARKPGGQGAIGAVAGLGEGLAGAIQEPWCVAVRWGEPPQGPGGRTRGQLRGVDPCRAPRGGRRGPGRPAATVVGRAQAKEYAYRSGERKRLSAIGWRERTEGVPRFERRLGRFVDCPSNAKRPLLLYPTNVGRLETEREDRDGGQEPDGPGGSRSSGGSDRRWARRVRDGGEGDLRGDWGGDGNGYVPRGDTHAGGKGQDSSSTYSAQRREVRLQAVAVSGLSQ